MDIQTNLLLYGLLKLYQNTYSLPLHSFKDIISCSRFLFSEWNLFSSSVALISNIILLTEETLNGELNYKEPTFNEEPSPDNDEATALELIPPPNGAWTFNDICG